jgi:hypothetical protein
VICRSLYKLYAPDGLKHRKNVDQTMLPDSSILAMLIWQTEIGIESQRRFCKFFVGLSHSRFKPSSSNALASNSLYPSGLESRSKDSWRIFDY